MKGFLAAPRALRGRGVRIEHSPRRGALQNSGRARYEMLSTPLAAIRLRATISEDL
jgi:hypothetical protein